jgi:ubiquitin carboxyl-terminal hydrolase L3
MSVNWLPIESNPDTLNDYLGKLGFDQSQYSFFDLFSTEDWAKEMIPQPVIAMIMLFPYTEKNKEFRAKEEQEVLEKGQVVDSDLFFMKQKAANACGSIALFHILSNLGINQHALASDSLVNQFKNANANATPEQRADNFNGDQTILGVHKEVVVQGDSEVCEEVDSHFTALIPFNGHLYELDGTKNRPINHGATNEQSFLEDACEVVKKFMAREPDNVHFSILVLAKS